MSVECRNCGVKCERPALLPIWMEIRVGGINSDDRFHLCPDCKHMDPRQFLSLHEVSL